LRSWASASSSSASGCFYRWWNISPKPSRNAVSPWGSACCYCCWAARQFRRVVRHLDPAVVPPGYWSHVGVLLNIVIAFIALAFALRFLLA
jgi:hypothetical protein